jgi:hypothetical protein
MRAPQFGKVRDAKTALEAEPERRKRLHVANNQDPIEAPYDEGRSGTKQDAPTHEAMRQPPDNEG